MDFISNRESQNSKMRAAIGIEDVIELFHAIPEKIRLAAPEEEDGLSEYEGMRLMERLAADNRYSMYDNYLGAGAYEHHIPAVVSAICSKSEFLTSYTPYQGEISQGLLQAIFEYQSTICALTGLDAANASLYDAASACAESLLMALRLQPDRHQLLIAGNLHPHYRGVAKQYLANVEAHLDELPIQKDGSLDLPSCEQALNTETAAILLSYPNFFGGIEPFQSLIARAKELGILIIVCANPLVYGLYASAAELGADIAVGDTQPFGLPLSFGGPYVGYLACRSAYIRQMPGRLVGETVDKQGRRAFVLTLQTREQHIRRDRATSNICTNQALAALASLITLTWYGPEGLKALALTNYRRAAYLKEGLAALPSVAQVSHIPFLNEFTVSFHRPIQEVLSHFRSAGIEPGVPLQRWFPALPQTLLVAVTETKNKVQLDHYLSVAQSLPS